LGRCLELSYYEHRFYANLEALVWRQPCMHSHKTKQGERVQP